MEKPEKGTNLAEDERSTKSLERLLRIVVEKSCRGFLYEFRGFSVLWRKEKD